MSNSVLKIGEIRLVENRMLLLVFLCVNSDEFTAIYGWSCIDLSTGKAVVINVKDLLGRKSYNEMEVLAWMS